MESIPDFFDIFPWQLVLVVVAACVLRAYLKGAQFGRETAKGKIAVVTGANCGIGQQIVRELNYRGAKVYLGCRSMQKGLEALKELAMTGCSAERMILLELDLSSFASVRQFAKAITEKEAHVDILVNNAGVMLYPKFKLTDDGHELTWQTNYLSHFLLTDLLMPKLKAAKEGRVVNVSAMAHYAVTELNLDTIDRREGWDSRESYSRSKLAMVMHAAHLTQLLRQEGSSVTINACHPGFCYTRLMRHTPLSTNAILRTMTAPFAWYFLKTPKDGAQCPLYCAQSKDLHAVSGKYFSECKAKEPSLYSKDVAVAQRLYDYSVKACSA